MKNHLPTPLPALPRTFIRTPYNYDRNAASKTSGLRCTDPSLTKQEFLEESDINTIVRRFGLDGKLPIGVRLPSYGDFTEVSDFRSALHAIHEAEQSFAAMPARVRSRFENNPANFVDFVANPSNRDEAVALGLIEKSLPPLPEPSPNAATAAPAPV